MLDLIFLALLIIVIVKSMNGVFLDTLCNIATVVGIIAAIVGLVTAFFQSASSDSAPLFLNIFVLLFAVLLRKIAQQFVKLYEDKQRMLAEQREAEVSRYTREDEKKRPPVYTDETFDDPELRFGKGGYTDNDL